MTLEELKKERDRIQKLIIEAEKGLEGKEDKRIKSSVFVTVNRYPTCCAECPMFYRTEYLCHNERGMEAHCKLGYMDRIDTRDWDGMGLLASCRAIADGKMILEEKRR